MEENINKIYQEEANLYKFYHAVKKRYKLISAMALSAALLATLISFQMTPVYRASFIIKIPGYTTDPGQTPVISIDETRWIVGKLNYMLKDKMFKEISKNLNIDDEIVKDVVSIKAEDIRGVKNILEVTIDVHNPIIINDVKAGMVRFLNQNAYVNERINTQREELIRLEKEIQSKISEIEVLKDTTTARMKQSGVNIVGYNPVEVETSVIDFKHKLITLQNEIKLLKGFDIVVEPVLLKNPVRPKKSLIIAISGITAVFLGVCLAYFMEWFEQNKHISE